MLVLLVSIFILLVHGSSEDIKVSKSHSTVYYDPARVAQGVSRVRRAVDSAAQTASLNKHNTLRAGEGSSSMKIMVSLCSMFAGD